MAIELQHSFSTARTPDETYAAVLDLERLVPCVEGGSVLETVAPGQVRAQIAIAMGVMALTFEGAVTVVEQDPAARRVVIGVQASEATGEGDANATVEFILGDGTGTMRTEAQLTGTAMSMGEAIPTGVLDEMIKDFLETFTAQT